MEDEQRRWLLQKLDELHGLALDYYGCDRWETDRAIWEELLREQ